MNKVILLGRLVKDVELKKVQDLSIGEASLAVNGKDGEAIFIDLVSFGKLAENLAKFFRKGSRILIEGELKQDRFKGKDGKNKEKIKVILRNFSFIDSKSDKEELGF